MAEEDFNETGFGTDQWSFTPSIKDEQDVCFQKFSKSFWNQKSVSIDKNKPSLNSVINPNGGGDCTLFQMAISLFLDTKV